MWVCLAGDWRLRRGSAVHSGNVPTACSCHTAGAPPPIQSRETLFYTVVIQRLFRRLLWSGGTEGTCRGLFI